MYTIKLSKKKGEATAVLLSPSRQKGGFTQYKTLFFEKRGPFGLLGLSCGHALYSPPLRKGIYNLSASNSFMRFSKNKDTKMKTHI